MRHEVISIQGKKDYMEDAYCIFDPFYGSFIFAGVYDGHKGKEASDNAKNNLHRYFFLELSKGSDPEDAFLAAYEKISDNLKGSTSGTTAVNAYIKDNNIFWANAGDSHLLVIKNTGEPVQLSEGHRLDNENERERVLDSGGVISNGYAMKGNYGIEPTRALGDQYFSSIGILSKPATGIYALSPEDKWVLLGSDGLFDFISNQDIGKILHESPDIQTASASLKKEVIENRKGNDNLTLMILDLFSDK